MDADLRVLIRKRGSVKRKLTDFIKFLTPIQDDHNTGIEVDKDIVSQLRLRVEKATSILEEFEEHQQDIEILCDENDLNDYYKERSEFTDSYWKYLNDANVIIRKYSSDTDADIQSVKSRDSGDSVKINNLRGVKLPAIVLPKFNGNMNNWMEFRDTFESLIHKNEAIGEIQKYHYLRASLGSEAQKIIQSLDFSAQNYKIAWDLLCGRYDNSRLLVDSHMKALFTMDSLSRESANGLRDLLDTINKNLRALSNLKLPTEHWDAVIIYVVSTKLDKISLREWEKHKVSLPGFPTLKELKSFLINRADLLTSLEGDQKDVRSNNDRKNKQVSFFSKNENSKLKCNYCKESHTIYNCAEFLKLSVPDRWNKVKELHLCSNCLCRGHVFTTCKNGPCRKCKDKHSSLLHTRPSHTNESTSSAQNSAETGNGNVLSFSSTDMDSCVLLSTAIIDVFDNEGKPHRARIVLDSGSQSSFISERLCKQLGLKTIETDISVRGVNNASSHLKYKCDVSLSSIHNDYSVSLQCFVLPKITDNLPMYKIDISSWKIPKNLPLADNTFHKRGPVDLLIGAELFWNLILQDNVKLGRSLPVLQNTVFGYVVSGQVFGSTRATQCLLVTNKTLHDDLSRFWAIEEGNHMPIATENDVQCEKFFIENVNRSSNGQFIVKIPLKSSVSDLGESKTSAIKRLLALEKKFQIDTFLKEGYTKFMDEYQSLGHMSQVDDKNEFSNFLPHHGVVREDSLTTKLRVVFDGSAVTSSGKSFNDIQYTGPLILNDFFHIVLRFRQHAIVVASDIAKMYRCILVHPDDRPLQRIVWRKNPDEPISVFELNTVTYGTSSAPYLALRVVKQLGIENQEGFPEASKVILEDMYVDDLITGFSSEEHAIRCCKEIDKILASAQFKLRKWTSNSVKVLESLQDKADPLSVLQLTDTEQSKILGVHWLSGSDCLGFSIKQSSQIPPITKRHLLSNIAKIFDPLGLISPCTILAKILMQKLWTLKIDWDDVIPNDLQHTWRSIQESLPHLNNLKIPRHALCEDPITIEAHCFCDASQSAYAAVIYLRTIDAHGNVQVSLLCSKTKVSPLKVITIPRLELCGALLASRLARNVSDALTCELTWFFWCDSQIVLYWLNTPPTALQVFVANRVSEIQGLTKVKNWHYIPTKKNPADVASRGMLPDTLLECDLWFRGPPFLHNEDDWPENITFSPSTKVPELKKQLKVFTVTKCDTTIFERYSSLKKLKRIHAYCLRFVYNSKQSKEHRLSGPLSISELDSSLLNLVKLAQFESFPEDIARLQSNKPPKVGKLIPLSPFLDSSGHLRVGGRLKHSSLAFDEKHQYLLSGKHRLSKLIFEEEHVRLLHAAPQLLLATVRARFWVTSGMNLAKDVVRNCIRCFRCKPKPISTIMANLPEQRVTVSTPFHVTGIDYAGPFILKDRKGRGSKTYKAYICLFICFASKAVHLELVGDLTAEAFIATLRRFTSRRGKPAHIYSDNATNFVGASRELRQWYEFLKFSHDDIQKSCAADNIVWHFIPPNSPHFGGLWESNIKGVKFHLTRTIGETVLIYEEFNTFLVQIEAMLNSRPLYPLSSNPNDLEPLTPSHLLIGRRLTTIPDVEFVEGTRINQLSRFQLIQQMSRSFWKQWQRFYLSELQKRGKWRSRSEDVKVGQLVLIVNDNLPPCKWLLGRIQQLHPGEDQVVRVVTLQTTNGVLKRAITKICPLPVPPDN